MEGGRPISTRGVAKLLKPFGVMPTRDKEARYYRRDSFTGAFGRYLSEGPEISVTSVTSVTRTASVTKKYIYNNAMTLGDACDAYVEGDGNRCHQAASATTYDGEV